MRAKDRTAANPERAARRACACAPRALLTPRLSAAAANEAARLRRMRAETLRSELHDDCLMQETFVHLHAEDVIV